MAPKTLQQQIDDLTARLTALETMYTEDKAVTATRRAAYAVTIQELKTKIAAMRA